MNKRRLIPLFTAFVLWGSQYVVSKVALRTIPPVTLLALRYLVSIPALLLVLCLRRALKPGQARLADSLCHRLHRVFRQLLPANAGD